MLDRIGGGILRRATGTGNGHDEARRASTGRLASAAWRSGGLLVLFAGLAAIMTFPQVLYLGSRVPFHSDPYFSMWRLGWMAHALRHDPADLFEANIFFPAHDTFAYSDAMPLPGLLLAPLFWLRSNPVLVYNMALWGGMILSGLTACHLARSLTGDTAAGVIAGVIFAFAPYRFDHYMHLELQFVFWLPIALLALHRLVERARLQDGLLLGLAIAGQALSCMYAAIFGVVYAGVLLLVLIALASARPTRSRLVPLALAAVLVLAVVGPYALVYARAARTVGTRSLDDIAHYGATWAAYVAAPPMNRLYGSSTSSFSSDELYLFPGAMAVLLSVLGVVTSRSRVRWAYVAALVAALELSRGLNGAAYQWLYEHILPFRALRAPARSGILVMLSLAMLSAYGVAWLRRRLAVERRSFVVPVILAVLIAEYASSPTLASVPAATALDGWLATQPAVAVAELPLASPETNGQSRDWVYMYQGLGHFQRMVNGYSGYPPASYYAMLDAMQSFPDERSIAYLRAVPVDYVVLRGGSYTPERWAELVAKVRAHPDLAFVGGFPEAGRVELVYAVRR